MVNGGVNEKSEEIWDSKSEKEDGDSKEKRRFAFLYEALKENDDILKTKSSGSGNCRLVVGWEEGRRDKELRQSGFIYRVGINFVGSGCQGLVPRTKALEGSNLRDAYQICKRILDFCPGVLLLSAATAKIGRSGRLPSNPFPMRAQASPS